MRFLNVIFGCTLAVGLLVGCASNEPNEEVPEVVKPVSPTSTTAVLGLTETEKNVAVATQGFGYSFFKAVNKTQTTQGNLVVSPLSAQLLLSMTANAADASAVSEIVTVLGCDDFDLLNSLGKKYVTQLPKADISIKMALANSVWYNYTYQLNSDFAQSAGNFFSADCVACDFTKSDVVVTGINAWCADKTNGLINEIIKNIPDGIDAIMANAMYLKGEWADPFEVKDTKDACFHGVFADRDVKMMHKIGTQHYAEGDGYVAVKKEMGNGAFAVTFVLPDKNIAISDFIESFICSELVDILYRDITIDLSLPRCKPSLDAVDLVSALRLLGINKLFDGTGLSLFTQQSHGTFKINQKTAVEFDEIGAEGASVTWNFMQTSNLGDDKADVPVVTFDRPYLFFVSEATTGVCLMAGKITDL